MQMILYFVSPENMPDTELIPLIENVAQAGIDYIQYRTKEAFSSKILATAKAIQDITQHYNIPLIINDNLELAVTIQADGVHVGQDDTPVEEVRKALPNAILGLSLNSYNDFLDAQEKGTDSLVDYYATSPLFHTETKNCKHTPWGLENLKQLRKHTSKCIIAIGGINKKTIRSAIEHGADGVAIVSAIASAKNVGIAIEELRSLAQIL